MTSKIHVITGERGVGKTILIEILVAWMVENGYQVSGILSPGIYDPDGKRIGILVREAATGHEMSLATKGVTSRNKIQTDAYSFNPKAIQWGNSLLETAAPSDLMVIDEIGPLEIRQNRGWIKAFNVIGSNEIVCSIVVIRKELLSDATRFWPDARIWHVNRLADVKKIAGQMIKTIRRGFQKRGKRNRT